MRVTEHRGVEIQDAQADPTGPMVVDGLNITIYAMNGTYHYKMLNVTQHWVEARLVLTGPPDLNRFLEGSLA
jgi:hypothetical protein